MHPFVWVFWQKREMMSTRSEVISVSEQVAERCASRSKRWTGVGDPPRLKTPAFCGCGSWRAVIRPPALAETGQVCCGRLMTQDSSTKATHMINFGPGFWWKTMQLDLEGYPGIRRICRESEQMHLSGNAKNLAEG